MSFIKYLKAVGTGPKGNRDLSFEESEDVTRQIFQQSVHGENIAAFLLGWRLKPETIEEFRGVLSACDSFIKKTKVENSLELGYPFDGKMKNPYLLPLVCQTLKQFDLNLVVSGDDLQPSKGGITIKNVYEKMKMESNLHYFDRVDFFKEMHDLTDIRMRLGLRSGFNTIEKLPNVGSSDYGITGVFHKPYVKKYLEIFSDKYKSFALVQGNEGTPEVFKKGTLWISTGGIVEEFVIDPAHYDINYVASDAVLSLEDSLERVINPSSELIKLAKLNAAVYLLVAQKVKSLDEAVDKLNI